MDSDKSISEFLRIEKALRNAKSDFEKLRLRLQLKNLIFYFHDEGR